MRKSELLEQMLVFALGAATALVLASATLICIFSCSTAHGATYGNDVAATSVVVATATAAGAADTTRGGK